MKNLTALLCLLLVPLASKLHASDDLQQQYAQAVESSQEQLNLSPHESSEQLRESITKEIMLELQLQQQKIENSRARLDKLESKIKRSFGAIDALVDAEIRLRLSGSHPPTTTQKLQSEGKTEQTDDQRLVFYNVGGIVTQSFFDSTQTPTGVVFDNQEKLSRRAIAGDHLIALLNETLENKPASMKMGLNETTLLVRHSETGHQEIQTLLNQLGAIEKRVKIRVVMIEVGLLTEVDFYQKLTSTKTQELITASQLPDYRTREEVVQQGEYATWSLGSNINVIARVIPGSDKVQIRTEQDSGPVEDVSDRTRKPSTLVQQGTLRSGESMLQSLAHSDEGYWLVTATIVGDDTASLEQDGAVPWRKWNRDSKKTQSPKEASVLGEWKVQTFYYSGSECLVANGKITTPEIFNDADAIGKQDFIDGPYTLKIDDDAISLRHSPSNYAMFWFPPMEEKEAGEFTLTMEGNEPSRELLKFPPSQNEVQGRWQVSGKTLKLCMTVQDANSNDKIPLRPGNNRLYFECVRMDDTHDASQAKAAQAGPPAEQTPQPNQAPGQPQNPAAPKDDEPEPPEPQPIRVYGGII